MRLFGVVLLLAGCHDTAKDRGTCVTTSSGDAAQCVVNTLRPSCKHGAFTMEAATAGLSRCKSDGYDSPDPMATSCDGGYSSTFDMSRNGAIPDDMVMSAFNSDCVVRLTKRD